MVMTATPAEAGQIRQLEHRVTLRGPARAPAAAEPRAFPPANSGYHDYAEMSAAVGRRRGRAGGPVHPAASTPAST
jgi:carboxypeptidase T